MGNSLVQNVTVGLEKYNIFGNDRKFLINSLFEYTELHAFLTMLDTSMSQQDGWFILIHPFQINIKENISFTVRFEKFLVIKTEKNPLRAPFSFYFTGGGHLPGCY